LDSDVRINRESGGSTHAVVLNRPGHFNASLWEFMKRERPVYSVELLGVGLVDVYRIEPSD
jgi:hypothetical protein